MSGTHTPNKITKSLRRSARLAKPAFIQPRRNAKKVLAKKPATTSPPPTSSFTPASLEEGKKILKSLTDTLDVKIKRKSALQTARYKQQSLQDDYEIALAVAQYHVAGITGGIQDEKGELARATSRLKACREKLGKAHQAVIRAEEEIEALLIEQQRAVKQIERIAP
ncbi:hypothetical protein ACHAPU_002957 [Fusarium lateritium]